MSLKCLLYDTCATLGGTECGESEPGEQQLEELGGGRAHQGVPTPYQDTPLGQRSDSEARQGPRGLRKVNV